MRGGGQTDSKPGFTLAEVLITLGIIGVVAALTMPALIGKFEEQELITRTRKTYASIEQALKLIQVAYVTPGDNSALFASGKSSEQIAQELAKYFSGAKYCEAGSNAKGCKNLNYLLKLSTPVQTSVGSSSVSGRTELRNSPRIVLNNGAVLGITTNGNDCMEVEVTGKNYNSDGSIKLNDDGSVSMWTFVRSVCGRIYFDVNGAKLPNQFGRDAYCIMVLKNKVAMCTWNVYGTESLTNILAGKKNPFVYTNYSENDEFEW